MIHFTSDTHFNHVNILKYTNRHSVYPSVQIMNKALIDNINSCVTKTDTLYHLGDYCMDRGGHWTRKINEIFEQIKCKNIHLILGNHDPSNKSENLKQTKFKSINQYLELEYGRYKMCLSHYPLHTWNSKTPIHLHGHCHGKLGFITSPFTNGYIRMDVGVDSPDMNYKPISIEKIIEIYDSHDCMTHNLYF